ncbi:MAG: diacylglycerol kinase family protein [Bacteroidota bacterium]
MRILFVINPVAGGTDKSDLAELIRDMAGPLNFEYRIYYTTGNKDFERLKYLADTEKPDTLVACGGDGTVTLAARTILNTNIALSIIPIGSANGLAGELNIPRDSAAAITLAATGRSRSVDTVLINNKFLGLHLADVGMNAVIVRRYKVGHMRGFWAYTKQLLRELIYLRSHRYTVVFPGTRKTVKAVMIAVCNSRKYGNGAVVNPPGRINDGLFEVCIFKKLSHLSLPAIIWHFFRGTLQFSHFAEIISTESVQIINPKKRPVQVDGEFIGRPGIVDAVILHKSLLLIVPEGGGAGLFI